MQVNFTGFKNTTQATMQTPKKNICNSTNIELTDDFNGKDLSEYKKLSKNLGFTNNINNNFINIVIGKLNSDKIQIAVNDRILEANDENLPMFTFIAKLTNKIQKTPDKEFKVNKYYPYSEDFARGVVIGDNLEELQKSNDFEDICFDFTHPKKIKEGVKEINDVVQKTMIDYFY